MRVGLARQQRRVVVARRGSPAPAARRPFPSAPWRPTCCPSPRMADAGGPMKTSPASAQACAKSSFSRQEAVARVDGLRAGGLGRGDDALASAGSCRAARCRRCAPPRRRRARGAALASASEYTATVRDAQAARGGGHAAGDLAAVGDQDLLEHAGSHPEHAEARRRRDRRVQRGRQATGRARGACLRRVDDAVVPQPRRGVVRVALVLVLLAGSAP